MVQWVGRIVVAAALVGLAACTRESGESILSPSPVGRLTIDQIATSASAEQAEGVRRSGTAPAPNGGPGVTVTGNQTVLTGGTLTAGLVADSAFDTVYVLVGGRSFGLVGDRPGGIEGYYEIRLGAPQVAASVLLTFPQEIPLPGFDLQFAVANSAGAVGPPAGLTTTVLGVGTGDVQVTLAWDADSDVDLHVVEPNGTEIYYGRRQSATGGQLDLDSNAACRIDGVRNENVTWPVGAAPRGLYTVRVNYWSACGVAQTNYTVRVHNGGSPLQLVRGSFTGSGGGGGQGAGQVVATFERTTGPTAAVPTQSLSFGVVSPNKSLAAPREGQR